MTELTSYQQKLVRQLRAQYDGESLEVAKWQLEPELKSERPALQDCRAAAEFYIAEREAAAGIVEMLKSADLEEIEVTVVDGGFEISAKDENGTAVSFSAASLVDAIQYMVNRAAGLAENDATLMQAFAAMPAQKYQDMRPAPAHLQISQEEIDRLFNEGHRTIEEDAAHWIANPPREWASQSGFEDEADTDDQRWIGSSPMGDLRG